MTTEVIVKAQHGWPVDVTPISIDGSIVRGKTRVHADDVQTFYVHSGQDLRIHEVQSAEIEVEQNPNVDKGGAPSDRMLQFFAWAHLPAHLQEVSRPFGEMAEWMVRMLPMNAERTVALRKLLEAKDCAVRARLMK